MSIEATTRQNHAAYRRRYLVATPLNLRIQLRNLSMSSLALSILYTGWPKSTFQSFIRPLARHFPIQQMDSG